MRVSLSTHRSPDAPVRRTAGEVMLRARNVTVTRRDRVVLADVDLDVAAGEFVALVGPNGAGKSTLVAAVAGDVPMTGHVELDGRPAEEWTPGERALRRAVLPQHTAVAFPFLGREVVSMGRAPWRSLAAGDDDEIVDEALASVDATEFADRPITTLSGGERARVGLARVLAQRAQLLLLDEPTAALDIGHQEMVMSALRQRAEAGDAVVVVLHDLSLASAHATRMVVVAAGRVVANGPPGAVCRADLLGDAYRTAIEVIPHPVTGVPMVGPLRLHATECRDTLRPTLGIPINHPKERAQ